MIRKARSADVQAIVELAVESVSNDPLPVRIDRERMADMAMHVITSPACFCWVSELDGRVVGALSALTSHGFWFERSQCDVLLFYCKRSNEGVQLIREFIRWVRSRPAIKMATFSLEPKADPRIARFLRRIGFSREFPQMVYVRGAA